MEKAFSMARLGEDLKIKYAIYYLKTDAEYWWESAKTLEGEGVVSLQIFNELFLDKYIPSCLQDQIEIKFLELKQEGMTVSEYEAKFDELYRFAHVYVDIDLKRAHRFQQGLISWIRTRVSLFELRSYVAMVQKA